MFEVEKDNNLEEIEVSSNSLAYGQGGNRFTVLDLHRTALFPLLGDPQGDKATSVIYMEKSCFSYCPVLITKISDKLFLHHLFFFSK